MQHLSYTPSYARVPYKFSGNNHRSQNRIFRTYSRKLRSKMDQRAPYRTLTPLSNGPEEKKLQATPIFEFFSGVIQFVTAIITCCGLFSNSANISGCICCTITIFISGSALATGLGVGLTSGNKDTSTIPVISTTAIMTSGGMINNTSTTLSILTALSKTVTTTTLNVTARPGSGCIICTG